MFPCCLLLCSAPLTAHLILISFSLPLSLSQAAHLIVGYGVAWADMAKETSWHRPKYLADYFWDTHQGFNDHKYHDSSVQLKYHWCFFSLSREPGSGDAERYPSLSPQTSRLHLTWSKAVLSTYSWSVNVKRHIPGLNGHRYKALIVLPLHFHSCISNTAVSKIVSDRFSSLTVNRPRLMVRHFTVHGHAASHHSHRPSAWFMSCFSFVFFGYFLHLSF